MVIRYSFTSQAVWHAFQYRATIPMEESGLFDITVGQSPAGIIVATPSTGGLLETLAPFVDMARNPQSFQVCLDNPVEVFYHWEEGGRRYVGVAANIYEVIQESTHSLAFERVAKPERARGDYPPNDEGVVIGRGSVYFDGLAHGFGLPYAFIEYPGYIVYVTKAPLEIAVPVLLAQQPLEAVASLPVGIGDIRVEGRHYMKSSDAGRGGARRDTFISSSSSTVDTSRMSNAYDALTYGRIFSMQSVWFYPPPRRFPPLFRGKP